MNTNWKRPQNGHSETSCVETLSSELSVLDSRDYTEREHVFKIEATLLVEEVF